MRPLRQFSGQDGFTLIEILVAMVVILVTLLGMIVLLNRASASNSETRTRDAATGLAREMLETSQGLAYGALSNTTITTSLQANGFADDLTGVTGWQVKRRNITFAILASACSVDDSSDGLATHTGGGPYCSDSPGGSPSADTNGEDYKRVTLTVTPPANLGKPVTETTVVGATRISNPSGGGGGGGGGSGISVTSLNITTPSAATLASTNGQISQTCWQPTCTQPPTATTTSVTPSSVVFQAITASTAQKVRFTVDGRTMATVNGPATTFNWTWTLPAGQPDGTYTVAAQVVDSAGTTVQGDPKPRSVVLNRYRPDGTAFTPASAGRNPLFTSVPEIEWYPSTSTTARVDRDIVGFDVYRYPNGALGSRACLVMGVTNRWCADTAYPTGKTTITYAFYPSDYDPGGNLRPGATTGQSSNVMTANTRPNAPTNLTVVRAGNVVTLAWSLSTGGTGGSGDPGPPSGDCVDFYRIYSKPAGDTSAWAYANRADRTPFGNPVSPCGTATESSNTITLFENDSNPKQYRITAVDRFLAESTLVTPAGGPNF